MAFIGAMTIEVATTGRVEIVDVTAEVADALPSTVAEGICSVFVPHTTAGVVINENERRLLGDLQGVLDRLAPAEEGYEHDAVDDNADAHLRATLLGESASVPVVDGELGLGRWQSVLFVECDGPRTRQVSVTVIEAN
jgi:secondary thiamine-phosphate synthase enzyme